MRHFFESFRLLTGIEALLMKSNPEITSLNILTEKILTQRNTLSLIKKQGGSKTFVCGAREKKKVL